MEDYTIEGAEKEWIIMKKQWTFLPYGFMIYKNNSSLNGGCMEGFVIESGKFPRLNQHTPPIKFIGYLPNSKEQRKITHPTINFCFIISSMASEHKHIVDGVKYSVSPPYFMFHKPDVVYETVLSAICEIFYYSYDARFSDSFKYFLEAQARPVRSLILSSEITHLINRTLELCSNIHAPGAADRLDRICDQLTNEIVLADKTSLVQVDNQLSAIYDIASYVEIHYMDNIDWNALIRKHRFSKRTFLRLWEKVFEMPPGQYVIGLKMEGAKRLLASGARVNEAAEKMGFADQFYFSRLFKRHTGISPVEHRKTFMLQ